MWKPFYRHEEPPNWSWESDFVVTSPLLLVHHSVWRPQVGGYNNYPCGRIFELQYRCLHVCDVFDSAALTSTSSISYSVSVWFTVSLRMPRSHDKVLPKYFGHSIKTTSKEPSPIFSVSISLSLIKTSSLTRSSQAPATTLWGQQITSKCYRQNYFYDSACIMNICSHKMFRLYGK